MPDANVGSALLTRWQRMTPEQRATKREADLRWYRAHRESRLEVNRMYTLRYRERHPERVTETQRRFNAKARARVDALKTAPCTDCGKCYPPYVMQFDHVRGVKVRAVSLMNDWALQRLMDEIAKCELVCANCHAERTDSRRRNA